MFSLKKKPTPVPSGKKIRLIQIDDVQAANRAEKSLRFLALAADENDPEALLECLYVARSLKKNHPGAHTAILAHRSHYRFLRRTAIFDSIHFVRDERASAWQQARRIARLKPDLAFTARPIRGQNLALWLSGVPFKLGGFQGSILARLFRWFNIRKPADLERLGRKDIQISGDGSRVSLPEVDATELTFFKQISAPAPLLEAAERAYVFLRYPRSGPAWPISYLPRLNRLCLADGRRLVVQLPNTLAAEDRAYLEREAEEILLLGPLSTAQLTGAIARADAVVGTGSTEKILASMLARPVVVLNAAGSAAEAARDSEDLGDRVVQLHDGKGSAARFDPPLLDRIKTGARVLYSFNGEEASGAELDSISPELLVETLRDLCRD